MPNALPLRWSGPLLAAASVVLGRAGAIRLPPASAETPAEPDHVAKPRSLHPRPAAEARAGPLRQRVAPAETLPKGVPPVVKRVLKRVGEVNTRAHSLAAADNASVEASNASFNASGDIKSVSPWGTSETTPAPGIMRRPDGARVPKFAEGMNDELRDRAVTVMKANFPPVRDLLPIYWLHVPKAGSSFATTIAHYGCGNAIPKYMALREPHGDSIKFNLFAGEGRGECVGKNWTAVNCATTRWNTQCGQSSFMYFDSGHFPVSKNFKDEELHHVVTMFREPTQRAISGWRHGKHDCENATDLQEYVECTKNCQTQLVSGYLCGYDKEPTKEDFIRAIGRVDRFGFIGLTSHWDLSICLFHAMHGGVCKPIEFFNVRPGVAHWDSYYNITEYGLEKNLKPTMDEKLYFHAKSIFWRRIREYEVTPESCARSTCSLGREHFEAMRSSPNDFAWDFFSRPSSDLNLEAMEKDIDITWPGREAYNED